MEFTEGYDKGDVVMCELSKADVESAIIAFICQCHPKYASGCTIQVVSVQDYATAEIKKGPDFPKEVEVYARPECPFNYCDDPDDCKRLGKCHHR